MKGPIQIFLDSPQKLTGAKIVGPTQKLLTHEKTHAKKSGPSQKKFDPRNPRKNYNPHKMMNHVKNILTHVTHATHVNI